MRIRRLASLLLVTAALLAPPARADAVVTNGSVTATIGDEIVQLCNTDTCRTWSAATLTTLNLTGPGVATTTAHPDFSLIVGQVELQSSGMPVLDVRAEPVGDDGVRLIWELAAANGALVERTVELHGDARVFASQTSLTPLAPGVLRGYSLDEVALPGGSETIHAFHAGADWRYDEGWEPFSIGDHQPGSWRQEREGPRATGQWLEVRTGAGGAGLHLVMERRNYASSRMEYDRGVARALVDLSHDLVYFGPLEEAVHAQNDDGIAGRARALVPGRTLRLEPAYTIVARDADHGPWEFYKYLTRHRLTPYPKAVTFNTNRIDSNAISTGAKDDVNFERLQTLIPAAREMGVDTFILDDGWQAISGDWCPDSEECPEPRRGTSPKFEPRFPDATFSAVRELLAGDPGPEDDIALGLWMTPMEFHPASAAFRQNPQWACAPVGHGTAALSILDPNGGSNEAGLGVWNTSAYGVPPEGGAIMRPVDYMRLRIERAINDYGATYFKFDFLVWLDCAGVEPADLYTYHDEFVTMLDTLQEHYPHVTFQIDETNDYRMFPFESVARGPSWFQNGTPRSEQLLHNIWNLAPFVPGWSLGQHALANGGDRTLKGVDMLMAAALPSHITFWARIDEELDAGQRAQVRRWTDFYRANQDVAGFTMPLRDDPLEEGWTGLQSWDLDAAEGYLLAFRQSGVDTPQPFALRGLAQRADDEPFTVTWIDPATGWEAAPEVFTAAQLRDGLSVDIPTPHGYAIARIGPA